MFFFFISLHVCTKCEGWSRLSSRQKLTTFMRHRCACNNNYNLHFFNYCPSVGFTNLYTWQLAYIASPDIEPVCAQSPVTTKIMLLLCFNE